MQITFTGHQLEVTDPLRQFAKEKLDKLQRHFNRIHSINVTFTIEKSTHIAEATVHVPGSDFHATAESNNDMYAAVDLLIDKLDRQIKKHKEKEHL